MNFYRIRPCEVLFTGGRIPHNMRMRKKDSLAAKSPPDATADVIPLRPKADGHSAIVSFAPDQIVFRQGDRSEAVYFLHSGCAKVHVLSKSGREAVMMILGPGEFFGESAMLEGAGFICSVTTMSECTIERIEAAEAWRRLREDPVFARPFIDFLVSRNRRYLTDLSDHHFYTTEQRLAHVLLRLPDIRGGGARQEKRQEKRPEKLPRISQEMLAEMVGTTRSRVNFFMNKFRRLRMIEYDNKAGGHLVVHRSLAMVLQRD
jgi:CRP/FNR family transcriptional regulator, cyclic AMP receptor protein